MSNPLGSRQPMFGAPQNPAIDASSLQALVAAQQQSVNPLLAALSTRHEVGGAAMGDSLLTNILSNELQAAIHLPVAGNQAFTHFAFR